jgi:hypothetical protein
MQYSGIGAASTRGGAALAATGVPFALTNAIVVAVGLMVLGGVVMIGARLFPRFAWEPVQSDDGEYRMRFTRNGRPRTKR